MQNSELYRRGVVVPLNKVSEYALRDSNVNLGTEVNILEIPNDIFDSLWVKNFFQNINNELGSMIDDSEEEIIQDEQIDELKRVVIRFKEKIKLIPKEEEIILELEKLLNIAAENKFPVFFIF